MKRIYFIAFIIFFLFVNGFTQTSNPITMDYNLSLGTSIQSFGNNNGGMMNYVFPTASFSNHKKWNITTGVLFTNNTLNYSEFQFSDVQTSPVRDQNNSAYLYVGGDFAFNNKFLLRANIYKGIGNGVGFNPDQNFHRYDDDFFGMDLGLQYKFSDKGTVNFQVSYQNGNSPFYSNPYNNRYGFNRGLSPFSHFQTNPLF